MAESGHSESIAFEDAVRQLAERISAIPHLHGPCRLEFWEDAALASDTGKDWQESLRKELESRHLTITDDTGATLLRVGLGETPTQLIFSASVRLDDTDEVRLLTLPRASLRLASLPVSPVRLEKQLIFQTTERLVDASALWNGSAVGMAVLVFRNGELLIERVDSSGAVQQLIAVSTAGPLPLRSLHSELELQTEGGSVLLPGKICQFTWTGSTDAKCRASKTPWRGATVLTPSCDARGWRLLADGSDWSTPELLQAVPARVSQTASASILSDFPGPILSINGEQNPSSALVLTRNLRTGDYEVYKVTLACGN